MVLKNMRNFTITLLSITLISFLSSCSTKTGSLGLSVNFPKSSPILTKVEKQELKKKIAVKNTEIFTDEEKEEMGVLEIEIR